MENRDAEQLKNQEDVTPSEALEKLVIEKDTEHAPKTTGTGANNPVQRSESLIIKKEEDQEDRE